MNEHKRDLRIIGNGSATGGYYNDVKVIGDGVINGDFECNHFRCAGTATVNGSINTHSLRVAGSSSVTGTLKSDDIRIAGNVDVQGDIKGGTFVVRGGADVRGSVSADDVSLKGYVNIRRNCGADKFCSEGPLTVSGLLSADDIDIKIHSSCKVSEIGGHKIRARRGHGSTIAHLLKSLFIAPDFYSGKLICDSIEGDEIQLEYTKAKVVRGKKVIIGDGCEVDLIEYKDECRVFGRSSIKDKKKIS